MIQVKTNIQDVTFTNHYDHVIGHSYNRRPWHILYVVSCSTFINENSDIKEQIQLSIKRACLHIILHMNSDDDC
jgi:hypothetical protein